MAGIGRSFDGILNRAQAAKAEDLAQAYARHDPEAIKLVDELLAEASTGLDPLTVNAIAGELDYVERLDRLTTLAEGRRNAGLREIDRRRAVLGGTLRRTIQEIEADRVKVIEASPAKGSKPA